jgi:ubiquinone biosynthesis accessory factor UbiK
MRIGISWRSRRKQRLRARAPPRKVVLRVEVCRFRASALAALGWGSDAARRWTLHHRGAATAVAASYRGTRGRGIMEAFRIDDIARRLLERVPPALRNAQADLESNFRAVLRERLSRLDLVSRDEFDAQARVLERTRALLEALEARLAALESSTAPLPAPPGPKRAL